MKAGFKVLFLTGMLGAAAACSNGGGSSNPAPIVNASNNAAICSNPANLQNPQYSVTNPQSPCYRMNINNPNMIGQNNPNSIDIGAFQSGGNVVIRNRQFQLSRGWGTENTADNCTVDSSGDNVGRPVSRALYPGTDNLILSFDSQGILTISLQTGVGQLRSPSPVNYALDGSGIQFPAGISLRGQPSAAYVQMESRLGFGMLKATDRKMADELGISYNDRSQFLQNIPVPSIVGNTNYSTSYVFNGNNGPALANAQSIVPLGGTSLVGSGVNQLTMDFLPLSGQIIVNPSNPTHVNEIYFDAMAYQSSSVVAISGTNCQASAEGQMLRIEVR